MSQPAYSNVIVRFDTRPHASTAQNSFEAWVNMAHKQNLPEPTSPPPGGSINGNYCIGDIFRPKHGEGVEITCTVYSSRYENCIWQCENIRDFFAKQEGCQSFEADVMTCEDSVNWYRKDENGDEEKEEQRRRDEKNGLYGEHVDPAN